MCQYISDPWLESPTYRVDTVRIINLTHRDMQACAPNFKSNNGRKCVDSLIPWKYLKSVSNRRFLSLALQIRNQH